MSDAATLETPSPLASFDARFTSYGSDGNGLRGCDTGGNGAVVN